MRVINKVGNTGVFMNLGFTELLLIAGIALLIFGPSRLPGLGKSLGEAIRGFKKGINDDETIAEARPVNDQLAYKNENKTDPAATTKQEQKEKETETDKNHTS